MADVLGTFEQAMLLAVLRLRDEAYGRAILKEVQTRLERDVAAGAVHATSCGQGLWQDPAKPATAAHSWL